MKLHRETILPPHTLRVGLVLVAIAAAHILVVWGVLEAARAVLP